MPDARLHHRNVQVDGVKLRSTFVAFEGYEDTILLIDSKYNLNEGTVGTLRNLCYHTCRAVKKSFRFIYLEAQAITREDMVKLTERFQASAIVFVDDLPAKRFDPDAVKHFGLLKTWKEEGIKTVLSTPFYKWSHSEGFQKGEIGKNLLGFNLKHITAACRGKNPFRSVTKEELEFDVNIIMSISQFDKFMDRLEKKAVVCIDTEGKSLAKITNTLFTIQFGWEISEDRYVTYVVPWKHKEAPWTDKERAYIGKRLKRYFETTRVLLVYHFGKFDIGQFMVALKMDVFLARVWDTTASMFALDENNKFLIKFYGMRSPYSLETLEANMAIVRPAGLIKKEDRSNMARFSLQEMSMYGAYDVVTPLILRKRHREWCLDRWVGYKSVEDYDTLVIHQLGVMVKTFALLERNGMHVNVKHAKSLTHPDSVFNKRLNELQKEILLTPEGAKTNRLIQQEKGLTQGAVSFSSQEINVLQLTKPAHLRKLFFDVCKLEPVKHGKSGEPSTDKTFITKYKDTVPSVRLFGEFNKVKTLKLNFADGIVKRTTDPDFMEDERLRAAFGFLSVLTGRLGVTDPNTQNIPVRADDAAMKALVKAIKANFDVLSGRVMIGSDFSAHEIRIGGDMARDKLVRKVFMMANEAIRRFRLAGVDVIETAIQVLAKEGDIHISNVRFFFKQDVDKSHILRYKIKAVVFGVLYGKMAKALARELGIEVEEAQALIDVLFERWHQVKAWMDNIFATAAKNFKVYYPNHRIRHLWGYLDDDIWTHRAMDRRAVNSPIQGFASDIGVVSIYESARWREENITRKGYLLDMVNQNVVHDAQYSDVLFEHMPMALYLTEHAMTTLPMDYYRDKFGYQIETPLAFGLEFGTDWSKLEEWNLRAEGYNTKQVNKETKKEENVYVPGIYDMLRDLGKKIDRPYDKVIADMKYMTKIRHKELAKDPYKMLVNGNNINRLFDDLHMFRDQKEDA